MNASWIRKPLLYPSELRGQGLIVTSSSGKGHTRNGRSRARALVSSFEECRFRSALSNEVTSTWHVKCHNASECALLRPVLVGTAVLAAVFAYGGGRPATGILWLDFDMKNIPEPKERPNGFYDYFLKGQIVEHTKQNLDIPRWARRAAGRPKPAANVNALDELPDSSWYTNRHYLHHMTIEELVRGPNRGDPPDFTAATVLKARSSQQRFCMPPATTFRKTSSYTLT